MPVISAKAGHLKTVIDKMSTGDVDVNPPYGDDKMKQAAQESRDPRFSLYERMGKIIRKNK